MGECHLISQHHAVVQTCMPQFAVFFADGAGFGVEMVQALDAAHAQDIARPSSPVEGCQQCRVSY